MISADRRTRACSGSGIGGGTPTNTDGIFIIGEVISGGPSVEYAAYGIRAARSRHLGGVNLLMADGSVHFVADKVDPTIWQAASMASGNGSSAHLP
jgi:prepilin-type processing-associated H-X9-DG protein